MNCSYLVYYQIDANGIIGIIGIGQVSQFYEGQKIIDRIALR